MRIRGGSQRTKADLEEFFRKRHKRWWDGLPGKLSVNAYVCSDNSRDHIITTIDVDKGTNPVYMSCKYDEACTGTMASCGYPTSPVPDELRDKPVWEWYRPEADALGRFHEDQVVDEYIRKGGLLLRKKEDK